MNNVVSPLPPKVNRPNAQPQMLGPIMPTLPHGLPPFSARDISRCYEYPAYDIVYCDPVTWKCYYLEEPFCSTRQEAEQVAATLNSNPAQSKFLAMVSLDGEPATH